MYKKFFLIFTLIFAAFFFLVIYSGFFGNPLSKHIVKTKSEEYINEKYSDTDYYIEKVFYSFKDNRYHTFIKSKSSIDTYFSLKFDSFGNFIYNNFDSLVTSKHNTFDRINKEYRDKTDSLLNKMPYKSNIEFGEIKSNEHSDDMIEFGIDVGSLELDKKYDIYELGKSYGSITYYVYDKDVSVEKIKEILLKLKNEFDSNHTSFYAINLYLKDIEGYEEKKYKEVINIESFLYSDIKEDIIEGKIKESIIKTKEHYNTLEKEGY